MARRMRPLFTRAFTSLSPEPGPDAGRGHLFVHLATPNAGRVADRSRRGSPRCPPGRIARHPRRRPFTSSSPAQLTSATTTTRSSGGRRWRASWCMEPPEVLAIHAVPHPNPKVRRVGFALDDPYIERVWAGVIGPSALPVLRRLPLLWRERERAVVDLREPGQSVGLGPSLARSGRTWRTIERIVGFGMAHWLPGDELGVRTEWRRSAPARSHGCPSGPARSTTGCSARTSTRSPSPTPTGPWTPTGPSTPPLSPPASTTSSTAAQPSPAAPASNHDPPLAPSTPDFHPSGSPTVVPHPQTQRAHPCRCPCGAPASRPPSVTR
jgi:hypothetical protein